MKKVVESIQGELNIGYRKAIAEKSLGYMIEASFDGYNKAFLNLAQELDMLAEKVRGLSLRLNEIEANLQR